MEAASTGELVNVAGDGPTLEGIVFEVPSRSKVVVAVVVPGRGPSFRTVHPKTLTERSGEGPNDQALRLLIRRTSPSARGRAQGGMGAGRGSSGHTRPPVHRTTGR